MAIIIEGIDNSGKSTLADYLGKRLSMNVKETEGPPKYPGEMDERIVRYAAMVNTIFVRHPCVSQPLYSLLRGESDHGVSPRLIHSFYYQQHFIIYCDPGERGLTGHVEKPGVDSPEHLAKLESGYSPLLTEYRRWALQHAHVIYRIGDSFSRVARLCLTVT